MSSEQPFIHPTAVVEPGARLAGGVKVWHFAHVRATAVCEPEVSVGKDVYLDDEVHIGIGARIQNGVSIYKGVHVGPWCFVGPYVVFTNDLAPRVGNRTWRVRETHLEVGSAVGAGAILICGIRIGAFALVGAGAVVTRDVPPFHLAIGLPAHPTQRVCACAQTFLPLDEPREGLIRDCCLDQMDRRVLRAAQEYLGGMPENRP